MESLPNNTFLEYNKDTLEAVRKNFNLDKPGVMKEAVNILEEWVKKQHHFTMKKFDQRYLETTIIISKGSIETAKAKLDKACTVRTLMPHLFQIHDIRNDIATELAGDIKLGILPKLTKNHERVFIYMNSGQKFGPNVVPYIIRNTATISEYMRRNDYSVSMIAVADYLDVNLGAVVGHVGLRDLQEFIAVTMQACGFRLKAAYFISSSKLIEVMVGLFKQILSAKLGARLHVLKDRESLKDVIDKNILPKEYGGTEKSLDEMQDRRYLETTIIASKGSIERAKSRLDRACTFRTLKPELFFMYDLKSFFSANMKMSSHAILPKMTKGHERVYILRNIGKKFEAPVIANFFRMIPNYSEYLRIHDYAASYYVILDYIDANFADLITKLSITDCQDAVSFLLDCCGFRLKACYLISSSKVIEAGVAIAKQLLSAKLSKRVHVLKTREELKDFIDEDILPLEYGGKERSLEELHAKWIDVLASEEHMAYFKEINSARTDESLRQRATFNEQYMGMPGSFRMLSVD